MKTPTRRRRGWAFVALRAVMAVAIGLCALVLPELSIAVLLAVLAGYSLISAGAAARVDRELAQRHETAGPFLLYGLAAALLAVALLWWPPVVTTVVLGVLVIWMALAGTAELILAAQLRHTLPHARLVAAVGLIAIATSLVLLIRPSWAATREGRVIGLYALLSGLFLAALALRLRRERPAARAFGQ